MTEKNASDIINSGNFDERNEKMKEPTAVHPVVQQRLDKEVADALESPNHSTLKVLDPKLMDAGDLLALQNQVNDFEKRIQSMVQQINEQFTELGRQMSILSDHDRNYKDGFVMNDTKITSVLQKVNAIAAKVDALKLGGDK